MNKKKLWALGTAVVRADTVKAQILKTHDEGMREELFIVLGERQLEIANLVDDLTGGKEG